MPEFDLEQKKERAKLAQQIIREHNRPIYKQIMVLVVVLVAIIALLIYASLPKWLDITGGVIVLVLVLWIKGLLESLKEGVEFNNSLPNDVSITDERWFLILFSVMLFVLLICIAVTRIWTSNIQPQSYFWLLALGVGLVLSIGAGWLLLRKEPGLKYETSESRTKAFYAYCVVFLMLGVLATQWALYFYLIRQQGVQAHSAVRVEGSVRQLYYANTWHTFDTRMKIEPTDSIAFEMANKPPFSMIKGIKILQK